MKCSEIKETDIWAYVSKNADKTTNKRVKEWINSIHYNEELFNEVVKIYKLTEEISFKNSLDTQKAKQDTFKKIDANKTNYFQNALKYVAVLTILLASTVYIYLQTPSKNFIDIQTTFGEKKQVNLPDGSIVWLNASSKISYYKKTPRSIYLEGEAFFKVAKDKKHPFIVKTPDHIKVKALGTSFNIKSYVKNRFTETVLFTGKVEVSSEYYFQEKIVMIPQDKIRIIKNNGKVIKSIIKNRNQIRWKENVISFENKSFKEIANDLNIQNNIKIHFDNHLIENSKFTASFNIKTPVNKILELLKKTKKFDFEYNTEINTWIIK